MDNMFHIESNQYCVSAREAAELLRNLKDIPTFGSVIMELYPYYDIKDRLFAAFCSLDEIVPSSIDRKIRNWLNGKNAPRNREDIFVCAFALSLSESDASTLLGVCTDSRIHYRNPKELTYAFALRKGYSYAQAVTLFESLPTIEQRATLPETVYTTAVLRSFEPADDENDFVLYYLSHMDVLGEFHNKAYSYFKRFMSVLLSPEEEGEDYSVERVIETYLRPFESSGRDRNKLDQIQKLARKAFPNVTDMRNMLHKRMDIPRKLLLLLYVVTENSFDDSYSEQDEDYITAYERFEQHWWGINLMLTDCGMPALEPMNPFDRLILYALNTENEDESMLERFDAIVNYLFSDN